MEQGKPIPAQTTIGPWYLPRIVVSMKLLPLRLPLAVWLRSIEPTIKGPVLQQ